MRTKRPPVLPCMPFFIVLICSLPVFQANLIATCWDEISSESTNAFFREYCFECHGQDETNGAIDLVQLTQQGDWANHFRSWEKIVQVLENGTMPPKENEQPSRELFEKSLASIKLALDSYVSTHEGDPGPNSLRRLNSAEFGYTVHDLTGLDLGIETFFVNDAVGGEGFTNVGNAQFMDDAALERYLEAAKTIANHAVIGAGRISFFADPGQTGKELSAIHRINQFYRRHGFRTAAGEGAEPFGLDLYPRALFVAWQFRHRQILGRVNASVSDLAREEGLNDRFCQHIVDVFERDIRDFPLALLVDAWKSLPVPHVSSPTQSLVTIRKECDQIASLLREWQNTLANSVSNEEESPVLTGEALHVESAQTIKARISWPRGAQRAFLDLAVMSADGRASPRAIVIWKNARMRFRGGDNRRLDEQPLTTLLTTVSIQKLSPGTHPDKVALTESDFVMHGDSNVRLELVIPTGMLSGQFTVDVQLDTDHGDSSIVRCQVADDQAQGHPAAELRPTSVLLANPSSSEYEIWRKGVELFASLLPEVSQREPSPSDRDPIPVAFDNTYNKPERNYFHTAIKYHRDDTFLVSHMLDDDLRRELDIAWTDLLTSFDYHHEWFRFLNKKSQAQKTASETVASGIDLSSDDPFQSLTPPLQAVGEQLRSEWRRMSQTNLEAEKGHIDDLLQFAKLAWRKTLSREEEDKLRRFYWTVRRSPESSHDASIRALIARVFASPEFLYRQELSQASNEKGDHADRLNATLPISDHELANRLSYLIWSSCPDQELLSLVHTSRLRESGVLASQVRRMLQDPKSKRLAAEFFGQWLGFYRFDDFRGIDARKFPELDEVLRRDMLHESIAFLEYIIREDRPLEEILFADYAFMNARLARHYELPVDQLPEETLVRIEGVSQYHRGGLLGLGTLHSVTSAPLRTSAVKRGDWVLRRLLGSPVPPPPADAGSIAADDVHADGLTVRRRLELHRSSPSCQNCHSRIDPLGFALENFDSLGRWRETYQDGQAIDSSGVLQDGSRIENLAGLKNHLHRQLPQFRRTLATKLLGYALGRGERLTDRPLLTKIEKEMQGNGKFSDLVMQIVTSKQFGNRRR